jgi:hypothetical protein
MLRAIEHDAEPRFEPELRQAKNIRRRRRKLAHDASRSCSLVRVKRNVCFESDPVETRLEQLGALIDPGI